MARGRGERQEGIGRLVKEHRLRLGEVGGQEEEVRGLISLSARNGEGRAPATGRLAELQEQIQAKQRRATEVGEELIALQERTIGEREVAAALSQFDPVWETLSPQERVRLLQLLLERVTYDGQAERVAITFRPSGIRELGKEAEPETQKES